MQRSVEIAPHGPRPPIKVRRVPPCEPPFDDEWEPGPWASAHQLALNWSPGVHDRAEPTVPPGPPPTLAPGPRSVVAGPSADARLAVRRFVRACVEVLNGHRPAAHLRQLARPAVAAAVVAQGLVGAQRVAAARRAAQSPGHRPPRRPTPVAVVNSMLCAPHPDAVEAAIALVTGERTWAMALRLECHDGSWSATALRLI